VSLSVTGQLHCVSLSSFALLYERQRRRKRRRRRSPTRMKLLWQMHYVVVSSFDLWYGRRTNGLQTLFGAVTQAVRMACKPCSVLSPKLSYVKVLSVLIIILIMSMSASYQICCCCLVLLSLVLICVEHLLMCACRRWLPASRRASPAALRAASRRATAAACRPASPPPTCWTCARARTQVQPCSCPVELVDVSATRFAGVLSSTGGSPTFLGHTAGQCMPISTHRTL
jgi:hypothetical protein